MKSIAFVLLLASANAFSPARVLKSSPALTPFEVGNDSTIRRSTPYAPGGMLKHVKMVASPLLPWWLLDVAEHLRTRIFRLSMPNGPTTDTFVIGDPHTANSILKCPFARKPGYIYNEIGKVFGGPPTMATTVGNDHSAKRGAVATAFSSDQVKRMARVALDKTDAWIEDTLAHNASFDVGNEMKGVVLSAITETAFEYEMSQQEMEYYSSEVDLALMEFAGKAPSNPLRKMFGWFIPNRRRAFVAAKNVKGLMLHILNEYRQKETRAEGTIIEAVAESDAFPSDDDKAAQLAEFLLGGHDTTAYSISWILLLLAKNPNEQAKLRNALSQTPPEDASSCPELKRVVKEGMRLFPVFPLGAIRTTGKDIVTSDDSLLPKGSVCFLPFMLKFRNPDIYDDPASFLPSRWQNPSKEMLDALTPFSAGKHTCVGKSVAMTEIFTIVAKICSGFELSVESEGTMDNFLTLKPVGARLKARKI